MLSKFSKRERLLIISTVAVTVVTVAYGFIIEPIIDAYSGINRQITANSLKLAKGYRLLGRAEEINLEYSRYANLLKPLTSDEEEIASMLKAIEALARSNKIKITSIRPEPIRETEYGKEFLFELSAEASADLLGKFMYDLQSSGNLLRVRRLTLNSSSSRKSALKAVMQISKPLFLHIDL